MITRLLTAAYVLGFTMVVSHPVVEVGVATGLLVANVVME
jgi:hypothetical protein